MYLLVLGLYCTLLVRAVLFLTNMGCPEGFANKHGRAM